MKLMFSIALIPFLFGCRKPNPEEPANEKASASHSPATPSPQPAVNSTPQRPQPASPPPSVPGVMEWIEIGEVAIRIESVKVAKPTLTGRRSSGEGFFDYPGSDEQFIVLFRVDNRSSVRKLEYSRPKGGFIRDRERTPQLTDEHGNNYAIDDHESLGAIVKVEGCHGQFTIYPKASMEHDAICFQRPVDAARELRLVIPAT